MILTFDDVSLVPNFEYYGHLGRSPVTTVMPQRGSLSV